MGATHGRVYAVVFCRAKMTLNTRILHASGFIVLLFRSECIHFYIATS